MAFAVALCEGDKSLDDCPLLETESAADERQRLIGLGL
jgi:ArsR family metal-binding transcriptional regulator